jgi:hypothetical protein
MRQTPGKGKPLTQSDDSQRLQRRPQGCPLRVSLLAIQADNRAAHCAVLAENLAFFWWEEQPVL